MGTLRSRMDHWQIMLQAVLAIFAIAGIGALARRLDWLSEEADQSLLRLTVRVLFPALILDVTLGNRAVFQSQNLIYPPVVGIVTILGGFALAWLVGKALVSILGLQDSAQLRTFALCIGVYNYAYVPLPLAKTLFGNDTVAVMFVHNLGVELVMWTIGIVLVSGHLGRAWWRRLLNGPTIAIIAALALNFSGLHARVPAFARQALHLMGAAAIPLSVLLIGAIAADEFRGMRLARGGRIMLASVLLRLGLLPALFLLLGMMIPASIELKRVIVLEAAMPSAVFPIVLARHYGGHAPTALRVVVATSIASLITMTLWLSLGMSWLGVR